MSKLTRDRAAAEWDAFHEHTHRVKSFYDIGGTTVWDGEDLVQTARAVEPETLDAI